MGDSSLESQVELTETVDEKMSKSLANDFGSDSTQRMLRDKHKEVKANVQAMRENYKDILDLVEQSLDTAAEKVRSKKKRDDTEKNQDNVASYESQTGQDHMHVQIKASNIVRASHRLLKITAELKTLVIVSDLSSTHAAKEISLKHHKAKSEQLVTTMLRIKDEVSADLYDMEEEVYQTRI